MTRFVLLLLSFAFLLSASEAPLKHRLLQAKNGDYVVAESNQLVTVLAVRSLTPQSLILEEITIPAKQLKERPPSWTEWIKARAPGHSSWSMTEIDLQSGEIIECYSFSRSSWIQLGPNQNLFATLIRLPLKEINEQKRRRIGPPPAEGESDFRQIWEPPLVFQGKAVPKAPFDAFETNWPQDGSPLANQKVTLYFSRKLPFPLPYWVQIDTSHATAHFRVIDSGHNLPSPHRAMPRKVPQFVGQPKKTEKGISLSIKSPKYFRNFELFAVDITGKEKQISPLTHSLLEGEQGLLTIEIDASDLQQALEANHQYTWLLVPSGHSEAYTETLKPFTWQGS